MPIVNTHLHSLSRVNAALRRAKALQVAFLTTDRVRAAAKSAARTLAPSLFVMAFAAAAHAQSIDFTPVQTVGTSMIALMKFVGSAMAVGGIIYAAFEWFGRHEASRAIGGLVGAIVGAVIVGAASTWGASTTGQAVQ